MTTLAPNQKVEIEKVVSERRQLYPSYIVDVGEETVTLAAPLTHGRFVFFAPGETLRLYAGTTVFGCAVVGREFVPHPLLIVTRPEVLGKMQRRSFIRLEVSLPVTVRVLDVKEGVPPQVREEVKAVTVDLSAGGVLLAFPHELARDTWVELDLFLAAEKLTLRGRVRRVAPAAGRGGPARLGVEFVEPHPRQQDKIVKFIFERQRELRQKGLL
ncbi:MAG: hypothetical protein PWR31_253 [Bacillota bacterium]|nr:hypothetical protein [Bacillota bacterium]